MQEYESVNITNPTSENFTWRWNGEPYEIKAGETKGFAKNVSFHLAKHLSAKMVEAEFPKKETFNNDQERNAEAVKFAQLVLYDNPARRMALFKILRDTKLVMDVIMAYPFKGFLEGKLVGTMEDYKDFVKKEGGTFETEPKGKPTLEGLMDEISSLKKLVEEKSTFEKNFLKENPKINTEIKSKTKPE